MIKIKQAEINDIATIHDIMMQAFEEYRNVIPPSSALEETVESIFESMSFDGEKSAILYENETAVGMIRFKQMEHDIYFYRLSVLPSKRRNGYGKRLIEWLEDYGREHQCQSITCKVRKDVSTNIALYESLGFNITDQEVITKPSGESVEVVSMKRKL